MIFSFCYKFRILIIRDIFTNFIYFQILLLTIACYGLSIGVVCKTLISHPGGLGGVFQETDSAFASVADRRPAAVKRECIVSFLREKDNFAKPIVNISPIIQLMKYSSFALPLGHSTIFVETKVPLTPGKKI